MLVKHKKILLIILACIIAVFALINIISAKSVTIIRDLAKNQKILQGSLSLADVEASWSGKIVFKNIVWLDPAGKTIAEIPRVIVSFDLIDGLKGTLGVNSIKDIKVEQAIFNLAYSHKKGLSIVQLINLDNLKKNSLTKKTAVEHEPFIGIFRVENSNLNFLFENKQFAFSDLNFKADLTANPNILVAMHVKEQDTKIDLALTSTPEKTSITGTAKNLLASITCNWQY